VGFAHFYRALQLVSRVRGDPVPFSHRRIGTQLTSLPAQLGEGSTADNHSRPCLQQSSELPRPAGACGRDSVFAFPWALLCTFREADVLQSFPFLAWASSTFPVPLVDALISPSPHLLGWTHDTTTTTATTTAITTLSYHCYISTFFLFLLLERVFVLLCL
jgi:hypothetical protein